MTTTTNPSRVTGADRKAVAVCLSDAMAIVRAEGANRGALARVSARSIALAGGAIRFGASAFRRRRPSA